MDIEEENKELKEQLMNLQKHAWNYEVAGEIQTNHCSYQAETILENDSDSATTMKGPTVFAREISNNTKVAEKRR